MIITGTDFSGATAVDFGAIAATSFTVNSVTSITAVPGRICWDGRHHGDHADRDVVRRLRPTSSPTHRHAHCQLAQPHFGTQRQVARRWRSPGPTSPGATEVDFGYTAATSSLVSSTDITAVSPSGAGTVDTTVTTLGGTSATSAADQFTYSRPRRSPQSARHGVNGRRNHGHHHRHRLHQCQRRGLRVLRCHQLHGGLADRRSPQ